MAFIAPPSRIPVFLRLGLWIAQQIVTAHGGSLQAQNGSGGGAVLTVRLPLKRGETTAVE